jgi:hypothetical protein
MLLRSREGRFLEDIAGVKMTVENRGKGPLAGWRGAFEEATDTFDIGTFLKSDRPTNATEVADLKRAIIEGGTFGDYRRVETDKSDGPNLFVYGPHSIIFLNKGDRPRLIQAIEELGIVERMASAQAMG